MKKRYTFPASIRSCLQQLLAAVAMGSVCLCTAGSTAASTETTLDYLKGLSIEDLLQTKIISVSKKSEHLFNVAAAITALTQEDIKRSGAQSIPELLRLVPGLHVAQLDSSRWAISSRGFNEQFANKLLVMIDGRSVYSPVFSGVFWNAQDTMLEDIERVEIIRGPGATVWGANAVNGVINIITKNSRDTQGGIVTAVAGSHIQPLVAARYGGMIDDKTTYRLFAKGFEQDNFSSIDTGSAHDSWNSIRAGFRVDRTHSSKDTLLFQGELYSNEAEMGVEIPIPPTFTMGVVDLDDDYSGGHLLANWEHSFSNTSTLNLQLYYDHTYREHLATETRDTVDLEMKHHWNPEGAHDIVWGIGYRWSSDEITGFDPYLTFDPGSKTTELISAFIQDDITVVDDTLWLTLGSKFEHNDYSGFEVQPSVRLRFKPDEHHFFWAAVSRAVRTPSRAERAMQAFIRTDAILIPSSVARIFLFGTDSFDSETLMAYEAGYRWQASEKLSLDFAAFYNEYKDIRIIEYGALTVTPDPSIFDLPTYFTNGVDGSTYGFELQATWQQSQNHTVTASYSWINLDLHNKEGITGTSEHEQQAPNQQFQIRSHLLLTDNLTLDTRLFYVDEIAGLQDSIDAFWQADIQLGWQATDNLWLSSGVSNLFDSEHQEFPVGQLTYPSEIPRQFWVKATYSF